MSTLVLTTADAVHDVLVGDVTLSLHGQWVAHLELSGDLELSGPVALTLAGENDAADADFVGYIRRSRAWQGRTRAVVVGGAGGLLTVLPPRDHIAGLLPLTALLVALRIADETGETLAPASVPVLAALSLTRWLRARGTALEALDLLCEHLGLTWRTLDDGTIWIGVDAFPAETADIGEAWIDDGDDGRIDCAPPEPALRPGSTVLDHPIERVTYRVTGAGARAELLYPVAPTRSQPLAPLVYREAHGADVLAQNADGTLELKVDDARVAELRAVPFRPGIPGARLVIAAGERVRIRFPDGDPSQVEAFDLDSDQEADKAIVRVGDTGVGGTITALGVAPGVPIVFVYTSPSGAVVSSTTVPIVTKSTSGSTEIFVR